MITITSKPVYDFNKKFAQQQTYFERFIEWLKVVWEPEWVRLATMDEERSGIDLVVSLNGSEFAIEVKTEFRAAQSGNLCFETVSFARPGHRGQVGWGLKMAETDCIAYIVPPDDIYLFVPKTLQEWVLDPKIYPTLRPFLARNESYVTLGVLMPISRIREICFARGNLRGMTVEGEGIT